MLDRIRRSRAFVYMAARYYFGPGFAYFLACRSSTGAAMVVGIDEEHAAYVRGEILYCEDTPYLVGADWMAGKAAIERGWGRRFDATLEGVARAIEYARELPEPGGRKNADTLV